MGEKETVRYHYFLIAAPALLNQGLQIDHFVNADTIAAGLSAYAPEKAAIQAGKEMLERVHYLERNCL